jgi:hypothetical protein
VEKEESRETPDTVKGLTESQGQKITGVIVSSCFVLALVFLFLIALFVRKVGNDGNSHKRMPEQRVPERLPRSVADAPRL